MRRPYYEMNNMKSSVSDWSVFGFLFLVLSTVYAPVLLTSYAFYDDYVNLAAAIQGNSSELLIKKTTEGRPLHAVLSNYLSFPRVGDMADLRYLRFVGIVGLSVLAWSVFRVLVRTGWGGYPSVCVSVIIATLPSSQVYAAWATTAFFPYSALISGAAFILAERGFKSRRYFPKVAFGAGASFALLAALGIYQSTAMFFWVFAAVTVLRPDTELHDILRRICWYGLIVMVGSFLGFVVYALASYLYIDELARGGLVQDIPRKIVWFFRDPLPNAMNFFSLSPAHWFLPEGVPFVDRLHRAVNIAVAGSMFLFVLVGLGLYFQGSFKERLWKLGAAVSLLPLSYVPQLVAVHRSAVYRGLLSLASLLVVYMFLAFRGYAQQRPRLSPIGMNIGIGSIALACTLLATSNVRTYFVTPQVRELEVLRTQLASENLANARSIYLIRPNWRDTLAPLVRYDEFGSRSSASWAAHSMVFLLLREIAPEQVHLPVTVVPPDDPLEPPPDSLVIDMRTGRLF